MSKCECVSTVFSSLKSEAAYSVIEQKKLCVCVCANIHRQSNTRAQNAQRKETKFAQRVSKAICNGLCFAETDFTIKYCFWLEGFFFAFPVCWAQYRSRCHGSLSMSIRLCLFAFYPFNSVSILFFSIIIVFFFFHLMWMCIFFVHMHGTAHTLRLHALKLMYDRACTMLQIATHQSSVSCVPFYHFQVGLITHSACN